MQPRDKSGLLRGARSREPLAMTLGTQQSIPAARNARVMHHHCPSKIRGRRESRMHDRTRSLACEIESRKHTSEYRYAETFRPSLRNGLRLIARSPVSGLDSHRHPQGLLPASLIPASVDQDHTPLPSALSSLVQRRQKRPSQPALNVRDDAYAPPIEAG